MSDVFHQYDLFYERGVIVHSLRQYILTVICITVSCGILQMLLTDGIAASLVKLISGLVISVSVLSPLINEEVLQWKLMFEDIVSDSSVVISNGETAASELVQQRIKEGTEAYILTKASNMGVDIRLNVELGNEYPNAPEKLTIYGNVSPYIKRQLSATISNDLGIPEENQIWIS